MTFEELRDGFAKEGSPDSTYGQCNRGDLDFRYAIYDVDPRDLILEELLEEIDIITKRDNL